MDEAFVLTKLNHEYYTDQYVMQSSNIHDLLVYMLENQDNTYKIFVTDFNNKQINYLEWRK